MFSTPFNWCDRRCERCRLSPVCTVAQATEGLPGDLSHAIDASIREMDQLMKQLSAEQGIDLDDAPPPLLAERTKRVLAILDSSPDLESLSVDALVVRMKIARLAEDLDQPKGTDFYRWDTVPNLLLLERLIERLHPMTAAALREELEPLFNAIEPPLRQALAMLVETGLAPSPFCVDGPSQDRAAS